MAAPRLSKRVANVFLRLCDETFVMPPIPGIDEVQEIECAVRRLIYDQETRFQEKAVGDDSLGTVWVANY